MGCYCIGDIEMASQAYLGGFVGLNMTGGSITKSYCTGNISAATNTVGYFVGSAEDGSSLFKCYYNSSMSVLVGGEVCVPANTDGTGATVVTLQNKEFLIDTLAWTEDVWSIVAGQYPALRTAN